METPSRSKGVAKLVCCPVAGEAWVRELVCADVGNVERAMLAHPAILRLIGMGLPDRDQYRKHRSSPLSAR